MDRPEYQKLKKGKWGSERSRIFRIRARNLEKLGFEFYAAYLASPLWSGIRSRVFAERGKECPCGARASQIHHAAYDMQTLKGLTLRHLWPCCGRCHHHAEKTGMPPKMVAVRIYRLGMKRRKRREALAKRPRKLLPAVLTFAGGSEVFVLIKPGDQDRLALAAGETLAGVEIDAASQLDAELERRLARDA